ncbi:hypothetical protein H6P81_019039 [Aristolochia fimbriata]|uniref:Retrotransposon gag domain-containing protein n=1 Tax=Aristolochia fimbriata TaxID=158543 RepID=A0AAV7E4Z3_ARIFI|nr:hypothetical protein H6P81_019039 [Aristolochia fimbriata]
MRKRAEDCMESLKAIRMRVVGIERLLAACPVMQGFSVKVEHDKGASASEEVTTVATGSTQPREPIESKPTRVKVPEPKAYDGVRDAKWRRNAMDGEVGTSSIRTWREFKTELKKRFCPTNVEHEARKKLRSLKHSGKIREYISQFTSLMLCINDMFGTDRLFLFLDGLKPWAEHEIRRREVKTLAEALSAAEKLT